MRKILLLFLLFISTIGSINADFIRPQTPYPPYPYDTLNVVVNNIAENVSLSGTLTEPRGKKPKAIIVLATGSGQQNRDEELFSHKPFKVIADRLTRNDCAVLRLDDRGIGGSTGDFSVATTDNFVTDIKSAISFLRKKYSSNNCKIGVLGHSEGGTIAIRVADNADFIITMAAPALKGDSAILSQVKAIMTASGQGYAWNMTYPTLRRRYDWVMSDIPTDSLSKLLYDDVVKTIPQYMMTTELSQRINSEIRGMTSPAYREMLRYNPQKDIKAVNIPWLAMYGKKDVQVVSNENLNEIHILNPNVDTVAFDNLNHLFQNSFTGLPDEYPEITETISENVLEFITNWINELCNN